MARNVIVLFCLVLVVLVQLSVAPAPPGDGGKPCSPYYMCTEIKPNPYKWFQYYYKTCKGAFCDWYQKCFEMESNPFYFCGTTCLENDCPKGGNREFGGFWKCLNSYTGTPKVTYAFWNSWVSGHGGCKGDPPPVSGGGGR